MTMDANTQARASWARPGSRQVLAVLVVLFAASGANCPQIVQQYTQPIPRVLPPQASLEQILANVNENSAKVQSLFATRATISTPGYPSLRANLAFERPRNFRLRAETSFTGPEVDLGSNSDLFWLWIRRNQPPAIFVCCHEQFAHSAARQIMPIEPEWLISALGVVTLDGTEQHQGPYTPHPGRLEIRSTPIPQPGQPPHGSSRVTVIDDSRGVVLEQHVFDASGARLATAKMSRHVRDPGSGAILPKRVDIEWPPAKFELSFDLSEIQVNHLDANAQSMWVKPVYPGYADVDLADPSLQFTGPQSAASPERVPPR